MARVKQITLYTYDELSEEAQATAREKEWDINVEDSYWWEGVTEDITEFGKASGLGCEYGKEFDCNWSELVANADKVAYEYPNVWREALGPFLGTFSAKESRNLARLERWGILGSVTGETSTQRRGIRGDIERFDAVSESGQSPRCNALLDKLYDAWHEFLRDLEHCYLTMLRNEWEYQTSAEAIAESIRANELEFDEDGNPA